MVYIDEINLITEVISAGLKLPVRIISKIPKEMAANKDILLKNKNSESNVFKLTSKITFLLLDVHSNWILPSIFGKIDGNGRLLLKCCLNNEPKDNKPTLFIALP